MLAGNQEDSPFYPVADRTIGVGVRPFLQGSLEPWKQPRRQSVQKFSRCIGFY